MILALVRIAIALLFTFVATPVIAATYDPFPPGSYRSTCTSWNLWNQGKYVFLKAHCSRKPLDGATWSEINTWNCFFGDIGNHMGSLDCNRSAPPPPTGCSSIRWTPSSILEATCKKTDGSDVKVTLETVNCASVTSGLVYYADSVPRLKCTRK